jgi:rod shape-determining protein MreC
VALSRRNGRSRATLLFLILFSITVLTLDFRGDGAGVIDRVRDTAGDAVAPVRDAMASAFSPVSSAFHGITGYRDLKDENAKLKERISDLQGHKTQQEDAVQELRDLQALDHLDTWAMGLPQVAARVVSAPVSNFEQTIELDKGSDDGIRVDLPVVTGDGLVGRVVDVSGRRSTVRLITDPTSSIGVRTARSSQTGIAAGEGAGRRLSVGFVDANADVRVGDLMVTSGLSGGSDIYPPSIPVARVTKAVAEPGELQQRIEIKPLSDIAHLRYVKVLQVPKS